MHVIGRGGRKEERRRNKKKEKKEEGKEIDQSGSGEFQHTHKELLNLFAGSPCVRGTQKAFFNQRPAVLTSTEKEERKKEDQSLL